MNKEELLKIAKPILFNTDMVRAILDGRKSVTRRVIKPANPFRNKEGYRQGEGLWIDGYSEKDEPNGHIKDYSVSSCWWRKEGYIDRYAPYHIGDILYVRETWKEHSPAGGYIYKAQYKDGSIYVKWRPSIHMPKEAARIFLRVTDLRVERLQDITDDQANSEGTRIDRFEEIWDSTIKKPDLNRYGWDANPWVWVIEFKRLVVGIR